ncbi:hypothetical protein SBRCBS47491_004879 [Sporothrix bragantina]|uniref:Uncharacterized protein n=1 Tax=Sporothrix bragantina TaxID=671064 RepID=A0ABP0BST1_9PEZI
MHFASLLSGAGVLAGSASAAATKCKPSSEAVDLGPFICEVNHLLGGANFNPQTGLVFQKDAGISLDFKTDCVDNSGNEFLYCFDVSAQNPTGQQFRFTLTHDVPDGHQGYMFEFFYASSSLSSQIIECIDNQDSAREDPIYLADLGTGAINQFIDHQYAFSGSDSGPTAFTCTMSLTDSAEVTFAGFSIYEVCGGK